MKILVVEDDFQAGTTDVSDFGNDSDAALRYLTQRELALYPWTGPKRVCYFRADSVDGLRLTHGNWFHRTVTVHEGPPA